MQCAGEEKGVALGPDALVPARLTHRAAKQNGTRLNQEIVRRLTASLRSDRDKETASPAELIELAQGLTEEQRMVLQRLAALLKAI